MKPLLRAVLRVPRPLKSLPKLGSLSPPEKGLYEPLCDCSSIRAQKTGDDKASLCGEPGFRAWGLQ